MTRNSRSQGATHSTGLPTLVGVLLGFVPGFCLAAISQVPLFVATTADPNVLFNMSIETPMGGAAYNDQPGNPTGCAGRVNDGGEVGRCYFSTVRYLGYFDSAKCYVYNSGQFEPSGASGTDYSCSSKWSGNFLNWATMTAIDMFTLTMTGGNRVTDTTSATVIQRARKQDNDSWFPHKVVSSTQNVAPSTVTPFTNAKIFIRNNAFSISVGTTRNGTDLGSFDVKVKVCDSTAGLESNCYPYQNSTTTWYKPEGLIQQKSRSMRFGVTSFSNTSGNGIDGGVLRSNMKYVGRDKPDGSGGRTTNSNAEIDSNGLIVLNPNPTDASESSVSQSGVIPYINKFSDVGYKSNDPASELFYESIRYFRNKGPTAEYLTGNNGGFPIIDNTGSSAWQDPIQYHCQKNFIIGINDANPWKDKRLPGTYFTASPFNGTDISDDVGEPSTPDTGINVRTLTNRVGELEGLNGTSQCIGCTANSCDMGANNKTIPGLGEVFGTCPSPSKHNSYYIAGLAYFANTTDIRGDLTGKQTVSTFMIDTQEYSSNPLVGRMNMLWLAGKYGGFVDANGDGDPGNGTAGAITSEWDSSPADGNPDNYVLATQPGRLVDALNNAFVDIESRTSSAAAVVANTTRLDTNTLIYQARFSSADWTGTLLAYNIESDGDIGTVNWDAANELPAYDSRKVFYWNPVTSAGVAFNHTNLTSTHPSLGLTTNQVAWLLGDDHQELQNNGTLRNRTTNLGDIVNSDPWYVGYENYRYDQVGDATADATERAAYLTFRAASTYTARRATVYVGANDGMLHGFDAGKNVGSEYTTGGDELLAFVPSAVLGNIGALTAPTYKDAHRYYVDGAPRAGDAYFDKDGDNVKEWHTVLAATTGAGGKGLFALDVTNPSTFAASDVLWDISASVAPQSTDLTDDTSASPKRYGFTNHLGFTILQPSVVRMANGKWAVVTGNGYESVNKQAVLYIIDVSNGHIIRSINTLAGSSTDPNGLSTPIAVDVNGDRVVDAIYAGDLRGNLWKFDVSNSNESQWSVAYGSSSSPAPLYVAKDPSDVIQPITSKPQVGRVGSDQTTGVMVYFGTGRYYDTDDSSSTQKQTFYGIWDNGAALSGRSNLVQQTVTAEATLGQFALRVTSQNSVDYTSKLGWYMDLLPSSGTAQGERVISAPLLRGSRLIFTTVIPSTNPCDYGGESWLMELSALDGARLPNTQTPWDISGGTNNAPDGLINSSDLVTVSNVNYAPSGKKSNVGIIKTPGVIGSGVYEHKYTSGSKGDLEHTKESAGGTSGRQSWRQLR